MTTLELKTAIQQAIEKVPEDVLPEILNYINSKQHQFPEKTDLLKFVDKVFKEDDELLRRLSQ